MKTSFIKEAGQEAHETRCPTCGPVGRKKTLIIYTIISENFLELL